MEEQQENDQYLDLDQPPYDWIEENAKQKSLVRYLRKHGPISESQAVDWFNTLLDSVEFAHKRGSIHPAIKPSNLLLTSEGSIKLFVPDLKMMSPDQKAYLIKTEAFSIYNAPEYIKDPSKINISSDIYSLGATLYTLLTAKKPQGRLLPIIPDVSANISAAIQKATNRVQHNRFTSCQEFKAALNNKAFTYTPPPTLIRFFKPKEWPPKLKEQNLTDIETAKAESEKIYAQFGVWPDIILTDKEFYSDETQLKTIKEKKYFISAESPKETSLITTVLIRQSKLRYDFIHSNRIKKADQNSLSLSERISEIKREYSYAHKGEEPSLHKIASILNDRQISSPSGKSKWYAETVKRIIDHHPTSGRSKI